MSQAVFPRHRITALAASGLVGLFSLFNMGGRVLFGRSVSDYIGRKNRYFVFFVAPGEPMSYYGFPLRSSACVGR